MYILHGGVHIIHSYIRAHIYKYLLLTISIHIYFNYCCYCCYIIYTYSAVVM